MAKRFRFRIPSFHSCRDSPHPNPNPNPSPTPSPPSPPPPSPSHDPDFHVIIPSSSPSRLKIDSTLSSLFPPFPTPKRRRPRRRRREGFGGSLVVAKRSVDPMRDFKRSMVEMVVEMGIWREEDLEELLRCYLRLNEGDQHRTIVAAFFEVWDVLRGWV